MQAIAAENDLAETAFFVREAEGYALRWFTPTVGGRSLRPRDARLGSVNPPSPGATPDRGGVPHAQGWMLRVWRQDEALVMDFPAWPPEPCPVPPELPAALGRSPKDMLRFRLRHLEVFEDRADVAALSPDFAAMLRQGYGDLIVTAPGTDGVDFVSRFFAPAHGIDEDPVTGSALAS
jgi:predicted PhzF superfamily epimerase YddE/YHI9